MLFRKYKNYLKVKIAIDEYNKENPADPILLKTILKSISDLTDDLEVNGVIDALKGIY